MKGYIEHLEHAEATGENHDWEIVNAIEESYMLDRVPPGMRQDGSDQLHDYLSRHPHCASCAERGLTMDATTAIRIDPLRYDDDDENLMPLCYISLYVLVARQRGWPVRGCDVGGYPNNPDHPWNRE